MRLATSRSTSEHWDSGQLGCGRRCAGNVGVVRRLLVLVSVVVFVDAMLFGALAPLVPGYAEEFGLSKTGAGLLVGAFGAGALLGGIPGGLAAARYGPKLAVVAGLALLALASFAFAARRRALGARARPVRPGLLEHDHVGRRARLADRRDAPRAPRRADRHGVRRRRLRRHPRPDVRRRRRRRQRPRHLRDRRRRSPPRSPSGPPPRPAASPPEEQAPGAVGRAFADRSFLGGLWLNTLPALLFGMLVVLVPLQLDDGGFTPFAIGAVFLVAGLLETVVNPLLGRFSDRRGRLLPIRVALAASIAVALAFAVARDPYAVAFLAVLAAISFGAFYTPGMALVSDRAEAGGPLAGDRLRDHEHGLGAREHERAVARGRARRRGRRRPPLPARGRPLRCHARGATRKALEHPRRVERRAASSARR